MMMMAARGLIDGLPCCHFVWKNGGEMRKMKLKAKISFNLFGGFGKML